MVQCIYSGGYFRGSIDGGWCWQGEVEIKDADESASSVRIDIEKTGPSELQTDGVTVNHTLFDVGHGSIFVLQLVRMTLSLSLCMCVCMCLCALIFTLCGVYRIN